LDHNDDAFRPRHECVIKASVERAITSNGPTNADDRHDQCRCAKDEEGHLATGAREERLNPLTAEFVAKRHDYFSFGASAKR
jgi:hypothetical protein